MAKKEQKFEISQKNSYFTPIFSQKMFNLLAQQRHTEAIRHNTFPGCTLWLTGYSGAGKTSIATYIKNHLDKFNVPNYMLDGDVIRRGLNCDLGFSNNDRTENIRRIAEVSRLMADAGVVCIVAFISPFKKDRLFARELHSVADLRFYEIFVNTPIEECIKRDTKGLYARALNKKISGLTGIDSPYEVPEQPEIVLNTMEQNLENCGETVLERLRISDVLKDDKYKARIQENLVHQQQEMLDSGLASSSSKQNAFCAEN